MLAAGADRLRNVLWLRGGEHEHNMPGRFLEGLQKGIKGGVSNLVSFVEDVDFESVARGPISRSFAQLADLVDTAIGGRIDFNDVHGIAGANLGTGFAYTTGFDGGLVRCATVQRHRQNPSYGRFPDPAMATKDVAMCRPPLFQSILQSEGHVFLPNHFGELLGTILACKDLIAHVVETPIIRDRRLCQTGGN